MPLAAHNFALFSSQIDNETAKRCILAVLSKTFLVTLSIIKFVLLIISSISRWKGSVSNSKSECAINKYPNPVWPLEHEVPSTNVSGSLASFLESNHTRDLLKEVDVRNNALRLELDQARSIVQSLEEQCRRLEQEVVEAGDLLEEEELLSAVRVDELRIDEGECRKETEQVLKENEMLTREINGISREGEMTKCAIRAHSFLVERLEDAQREVAGLQRNYRSLMVERDETLSLTSCILNKEPMILNSRKPRKSTDINSPDNRSVQKNIINDLKSGPVTGSEAFRSFVLSL